MSWKSASDYDSIEIWKFDNALTAIENLSRRVDHDDSFFIVDLEDVRRKYLNWMQRLPRVTPFYAAKCNLEPTIIKLLAHLGAGFDCASRTEIETALGLKIPPGKIIFAHPCKRPAYIDFAKQVGVERMTFDNAHELFKTQAAFPDAKCVLRIKTNDSNAMWRLSEKFGADMKEAKKLIRLTQEMGLCVEGVAFHVGSNQMSANAFRECISNARELFDYALSEFGVKMRLLDIGGGFPGASDEASVNLFNETAKGINER
jgi:ornithine decarboxylase